MSAQKRPAQEPYASSQLVKRARDQGDAAAATAAGTAGTAVAVVNTASQNGALIQAIPRTSGLEAPIMELTGHTGEVFATRFDPTGRNIASGSMDRTILLWRTYGDCANYGQLTGHKGAVLDLQWSRDGQSIYSASADGTLGTWDVETGTRVRRHEGHEGIVNSVAVAPRGAELLLSAGDDGTVGVWDPRQKRAADHFAAEGELPLTAVAAAEAGHEVYTGGIDGDVVAWDVRRGGAVAYRMPGHADTVTSLALSPHDGGQTLLSHAHDSTVRTWDVRPFAPAQRLLATYDGAPAGPEKNLYRASWSPRGDRIAAGAGDATVVVWETATGKMLYKLPGHKGAVNDVRFAPSDEPIIVSGSSDRNLMLGELGR